MKWSIRIGRFAGIDVLIHSTFFLLLLWVAFMNWREWQSIGAVITGVTFIMAIFLCVVLHEFGHALVARRYGIKTRDIILLPIGGVARLERLPKDPRQELRVALAGPAVNGVIAIFLFLWLHVSATLEPLQALSLTSGPFMERLLAVNLFMIAFNLLPAFPMDGGRVLRATLAIRQPYDRATKTAASIGRGMAVLFGLFGLFFNPFLLFIALFVWIGAAQEANTAKFSADFGGIPVQQAMISDFKTLCPEDSLDRAVSLTLSGSQKDFPILHNGSLAGILTQTDLLKALSEPDKHQTVGSAAQKEFVTVSALEMLETAFAKLHACACHTLPVVQAGRLVGLVTMENLGEYMRIQAAMNP